MSWLAAIWSCFAAFWQELFSLDDATVTPTVCLDPQRRLYVTEAIGAQLPDHTVVMPPTLTPIPIRPDNASATLCSHLGLSSLPRLAKTRSHAANSVSHPTVDEPFLAGVAMVTPAQRTLSAFWELLKQIDAQYGLFRRYARSQRHLNGVGVPTPERLGQFFLETGEGSPAMRYAVARDLLRYHPHATATRQLWRHLTMAGAALRP